MMALALACRVAASLSGPRRVTVSESIISMTVLAASWIPSGFSQSHPESPNMKVLRLREGSRGHFEGFIERSQGS